MTHVGHSSLLHSINKLAEVEKKKKAKPKFFNEFCGACGQEKKCAQLGHCELKEKSNV